MSKKTGLGNFPIIHIPNQHRAVQHTGWKSTAAERINTAVVLARAGSVVVCPKCGARIGRLYSDLYSGVTCRADQIEFEPGQKKHVNQKAECAKCGEGYMKAFFRFTNGKRQVATKICIEVHGGMRRWIGEQG
jgi:ribosomal protein S27E